MSRVLAVLYAVIAYVIFLATFLYAIAFVGNLFVPRSIDIGPAAPVEAAFVIDVVLLGIFALQHSLMARPFFKRWWTKFIPPSIERSTYVLFANLALILLYWQWRPITMVVWDVSGASATALWAVFWAGWLTVLISTFMISHFELFGLTQVWLNFKQQNPPVPQFRAPFFYAFVRHPIYMGFILAFWAAPKMTEGHLLFSLATTAYILIAIQLEERDLIGVFGDAYRNYRRSISMLIPMPPRS